MLRRPLGREVAVEVEALDRPRHLDLDAVVVQEPAFGEVPVERAVAGTVDRIAPNEQPLLLRVRTPGPVRVFDPHVKDAAVAVEVLDQQAVLRLLPRIRPHARANEAPLLEPALRAVGIEAWNDVERASVEHARHVLVPPMLRQ